MRVLVVVAGLVLALILVDRLLLAAEARGWIYWRRRKASTGTFGGALLEVQKLVEPGQRHVAEAREERPAAPDDEGDPPTTGADRRD